MKRRGRHSRCEQRLEESCGLGSFQERRELDAAGWERVGWLVINRLGGGEEPGEQSCPAKEGELHPEGARSPQRVLSRGVTRFDLHFRWSHPTHVAPEALQQLEIHKAHMS